MKKMFFLAHQPHIYCSQRSACSKKIADGWGGWYLRLGEKAAARSLAFSTVGGRGANARSADALESQPET